MSTPILTTKLYIPPIRSDLVPRPRLIERLNEGLHSRLTLISAPAGFGKTTLVSDWLGQSEVPVAWLSLDESDNDLARFLGYLAVALETVQTDLGADTQLLLQSPRPPPQETIMTLLINRSAGSFAAAGASGHCQSGRSALAPGPAAHSKPTGRGAGRSAALDPD